MVSDCGVETGWKQSHYVSETAAFAAVTGVFIARNNLKWAWPERRWGIGIVGAILFSLDGRFD